MTQEELKKVLEAHKHFIAQDCQGWENMRADLNGANLRQANLWRTDLRGADLNGADLRGANLRGADLRRAYLGSANLGGAYLNGADLGDAELWRADLRSADLKGAYLGGAYLSGANLGSANLSGANLGDADLSGAYLGGANLRSADLSDAKYNERTAFLAFVCPEEGDFIAWKKVGDAIVKLRIPSESKRSSATTRKCRCEFAEVLELQSLDGTPYNDDKVVNDNYVETIYKVGEIVHPDSWDDNRWNECSHGIHFFITRDEAVRYN